MVNKKKIENKSKLYNSRKVWKEKCFIIRYKKIRKPQRTFVILMVSQENLKVKLQQENQLKFNYRVGKHKMFPLHDVNKVSEMNGKKSV